VFLTDTSRIQILHFPTIQLKKEEDPVCCMIINSNMAAVVLGWSLVMKFIMLQMPKGLQTKT